MAGADQTSAKRPSVHNDSDSRTWVLFGLLLFACGLQLLELPKRAIDPDELEHLHAACMVARGQVPYRDFFEHHAPLLYYSLLPVFKFVGPELSVLWWGRGLMTLCSLASLWLTARLGRRFGGPVCGMAAATLLAWTSIFHAKGVELRPDVPAAFLILLAMTIVVERPGRFWSVVVAGLIAGLATLFTQKAIVPVAGLAVAGMLREWIMGNRRRVVAFPAGLAIGGGIAWGAAYAAFGLAGAAGDLWHGTVVQLVVWTVRSQRWEHLRPTLAADIAVWFAGGIELAACLRAARSPEDWRSGRHLVAVATAFSVFSLVWVKATYPQYYLLWFPFLVLLAARRFVIWSEEIPSLAARGVAIAGGVGLTLGQIWLWRRAERLGHDGALPSLVELLQHASSHADLILMLGLLVLAFAAIAFLVRRPWSAGVLLLALLGMFHAILRNFDVAVRSNDEQLRRIFVVHSSVPPDGTILDGFSGYGALRPHAYYYWWINEYSLGLMTPAERETELLATLTKSPPAAVLFDDHLQLLPQSVTDWIRSRYEPLTNEPWFWLPRDARRRDAGTELSSRTAVPAGDL